MIYLNYTRIRIVYTTDSVNNKIDINKKGNIILLCGYYDTGWDYVVFWRINN